MAKQPKPIQIQAQEAQVEQLFPLNGISVASTYDSQPSGTTPVGLNVRSFESLTRRGRGGTRPGLSRYINSTVAGANKIQHLTYIVDPQAEALAGGTPAGSVTDANRNLFGGMGGFAPVRYPIEPGRTYPPTPGQLMTGQFQVFQANGPAGTPSMVGSIVVTVNGLAFCSGSLTSAPNVSQVANYGPLNVILGPTGTNVLSTVFTWSNANVSDIIGGQSPQLLFSNANYPSGLGGTTNQVLPATANGTQTVTGNF